VDLRLLSLLKKSKTHGEQIKFTCSVDRSGINLLQLENNIKFFTQTELLNYEESKIWTTTTQHSVMKSFG
jgi:hypothetical protein